MSSLYLKNVPPLERATRLVVATGGAIAAVLLLASPWSWITSAAMVGFGVTGVLGYCPMCAMVGRRLDATKS